MIGEVFLRRLWASRPVRFVAVGGINTIFGYGTFVSCLAIGCAPAWALAISQVLGVAFNFLTSGSIAFEVSLDPRRLPAFVAVYGILYVVNVALLEMLGAFGWRAAFAQILLILPLAALSYLLQRQLVFGTRSGSAW